MAYKPSYPFLLLLLVLPSSFEATNHDPPSEDKERMDPGAIVYPPEIHQPQPYPLSPSRVMTFEKQPETYAKPSESGAPPKSAIPYLPQPSGHVIRVVQPEAMQPQPQPQPQPPHKPVELSIPLENRESSVSNPFVNFNRPEVVRSRGARRFENYYPKMMIPSEETDYDYAEKRRRFPDVMYDPETINRPFWMYNRQPARENYGPEFVEPPKSRRRPVYRRPFVNSNQRTTQAPTKPASDVIPKVIYEEPPQNDTESETPKHIPDVSNLESQTSPANKTSTIYTIITDEKSEPVATYLRVPDPEFAVEKPKMRRISKPGNIPVPFIKVIRFYPITDIDPDDDSSGTRIPKFYVRGETSFSSSNVEKTPEVGYKPNDETKLSADTGYARYVPVFYDIPSYYSRSNKTDAKASNTE